MGHSNPYMVNVCPLTKFDSNILIGDRVMAKNKIRYGGCCHLDFSTNRILGQWPIWSSTPDLVQIGQDTAACMLIFKMIFTLESPSSSHSAFTYKFRPNRTIRDGVMSDVISIMQNGGHATSQFYFRFRILRFPSLRTSQSTCRRNFGKIFQSTADLAFNLHHRIVIAVALCISQSNSI